MPVPWAAHRGFGRKSFNPRFKEKEFYQWQIKSHFNQSSPIQGAVRVDAVYHMAVPKTSKVRRLQMLNGMIHHLSRPDIDNLNKFLCDCLKTIVFEDDNQVVEINAKKIYGERPKTVVNITQI